MANCNVVFSMDFRDIRVSETLDDYVKRIQNNLITSDIPTVLIITDNNTIVDISTTKNTMAIHVDLTEHSVNIFESG